MKNFLGHRLLFLYLAVFITIVGFGMVFPLLPFYAQRFGATPVQLGFLAASFSIAQFLAAPIVGRLSDRYGRKPVLTIALLGTSASFFAFGFAPSLVWLFVSRAIHGAFSSGVFPIASAYIGDSTAKKERVAYMSKLTATLALGFIVGPAVAGMLAPIFPALPFLIAGLLALCNALFIFVFLRESLTKKAETFVLKEGLVNIGAIIRAFRGEFGTLFFLLFAWAFALSNLQVAIPLFVEEAFSFHEQQTGFIFAWIGTVAATIQWFFLSSITRKLGELPTMALGTVGMAIGQALISYAPAPAFLFIFISISTVGSALLRPTANAFLSERTKEGQGTTMGFAFSFESLGRVAGPLAAGVFIATWGIHSQFLLSAAILAIALLFLVKPLLVERLAQSG